MNFLKKLDLLMKQNGLSKKSLSAKSGIPYTTIFNWYKRGYDGLQVSTLQKLNNYFGTTFEFWISDEITDPNYGKTSNFEITFEEMELIKKYRSLNSFDKDTIQLLVSRECERSFDYQIDQEQIAALNLGKTILENSNESEDEQIG